MDNYYYLDDTYRPVTKGRRGRGQSFRQNGPLYYGDSALSYNPYATATPRPFNNNNYYMGSAGQAYPYFGNYAIPQSVKTPADYYYDTDGGGRKGGSKTAVIFVAILLILGVFTGIGLGVYFSIFAEGDSIPPATSTTAPPATTQPVPTIPLSGLLTLLQDFQEALNNKFSTEFTDLASQFCANMTAIYSASSLILQECVVHNFIEGSVKVNYTLSFQNVENSEEPEYVQEVQQNASDVLVNAINDGNGDLSISTDGLEFQDDGDDCVNSDCDQICTDGHFTFTCSCYSGFSLADDGKNCTGLEVYLTGVIVLNETYVDDFHDANSEAYHNKVIYICNELDTVLGSGNYSNNYTGCAVNNFLNGSIVTNLTLSFEVSSVTNLTQFLEDVGDDLEIAVENQNIFSESSITYFDFDNDIKWCYNEASVCGQTGCDGIQCVCDEGEFYHAPSDCRETSALVLIPPYTEIDTVLFSTELVPGSKHNTSYHVIVCIVRTNLTNEQGDHLTPTWINPQGNAVPVYPNPEDLNDVVINDFSYKDVLLYNGTWILDGFYNSYVNALAFSDPQSSDSGTYSCQVEGMPTMATFVNINFVDCTDAKYFKCSGDKQCIAKASLCDGEVQCLDTAYKPYHLDELFCNCTNETFSCANEIQCVPNELQCDAYGRPDCEDGSDQQNCVCSDDTYGCTSGDRCIPHDWVCDGSPDCPDSDDETDPACSTVCDVETHYLCQQSTVCITKSKLCDGYKNCPEGDDEDNCVQDCDESEVSCPGLEHVCIPSDHICDGLTDCPNGGDETLNTCGCFGFTCTLNDMCVSTGSVCDGYCQCSDCSDELQNCNCTAYQCNNTQCLRWSEELAFCDGEADCFDGSDEPANCSCTANQFDCGNKCIPMTSVCDGDYDCDLADSNCPASLDEEDCECSGFTCNTCGTCLSNSSVCNGYCECSDCSDELQDCHCTAYQCNNTQCLFRPEEWAFCDGLDECFDGSDEPANCSCTANQFDCGSKCIPMTSVCDGYFNCDPAEFNYMASLDEIDCNCTAESFKCDNGECIHPYYVCNYNDNCGDSSDERNCSYCDTEDGWYVCEGHGMCILQRLVCDGIQHCVNGADEWNCTECLRDTFKCMRDGKEQCVPNSWICDGATECDDGQDELNCENCTEFSCNDHSQCFNYSQQCDGTEDCSDGSDEWDCFRADAVSGVLKYFDGENQELIPVCGNLWDVRNNQEICDLLGEGLTLGHEVVSNVGSDDRYLIFGDTSQIGTLADCGAAIALKVMCEASACGKRSENLASGFIIRGEEAKPGEWPWQVTLFGNGRFKCGGTLVDHFWVVTAAHCIHPTDDGTVYTVRLGSVSREAFDPNALELSVAMAIAHPEFHTNSLSNDIGVLKLAHKVVYSDFIRPACLPEHREFPDHVSNCFMTGFGTINQVNPNVDRQIVSDVLLGTKMTIHSTETCLAERIYADPTMVCTGYKKASRSGCQGDSGGPLVCKNEFNTWELTGAFSWTIRDFFTGTYCTSYSGFANVPRFVNWIKQQMQN